MNSTTFEQPSEQLHCRFPAAIEIREMSLSLRRFTISCTKHMHIFIAVTWVGFTLEFRSLRLIFSFFHFIFANVTDCVHSKFSSLDNMWYVFAYTHTRCAFNLQCGQCSPRTTVSSIISVIPIRIESSEIKNKEFFGKTIKWSVICFVSWRNRKSKFRLQCCLFNRYECSTGSFADRKWTDSNI